MGFIRAIFVLVVLQIFVLDAYQVTHHYDSNGNLIDVESLNRPLLHFDYDPLNRPIRVLTAPDETEELEWDAIGCLTKCGSSGASTHSQFDSCGRLLQTTHPNGAALKYARDAKGRITKIDYPDHLRVCYTYDLDDHITSIRASNDQDINLRVSYEWNTAANRLTCIKHRNGWESHLHYDKHGRPTSIKHLDATHQEQLSCAFEYDNNGRCTRRKLTNRAGSKEATYKYDARGQLIEVKWSDGSFERYKYDVAGNRLSKHTPAGLTTYVYDKENQLVRAGDTHFTFDTCGNCTSQTSPKGNCTFDFDGHNRLRRCQSSRGTVSMHYNPQGSRTTKEGPAQSIEFLNHNGPSGAVRLAEKISAHAADYVRLRNADQPDIPTASWNPLRGAANTLYSWFGMNEQLSEEQHKSPSGWRSFVMGIGTVCQVEESQSYYFLYDRPNGHIIGKVDAAGNLVGEYDYTPFGEIKEQRGELPVIGLAGGRWDEETGLLLIGYRYYDPSTGRFLSRDPFTGHMLSPLDWNPYLYAHNDPVNFFDPTGLALLEICCVMPFHSFLTDLEGATDLPANKRLNRTLSWMSSSTREEVIAMRGLVQAPDGSWCAPTCSHPFGHGYLAIHMEGKASFFSGNAPKGVNNHQCYENRGYAKSCRMEISDHVAGQIREKLEEINSYNFKKNNCVDYVTLALDTADIKHDNFKNFGGYGWSSPRLLCNWIDKVNAQQKAVNYRDSGGVQLNAVANINVMLTSLHGVTFDPITNQLILIGEHDIHAPKMDVDDLTVAIQSIFGLGHKPPQDPGVSIGTEPSDRPGYFKVRYDGMTENTRFGQIMFEADRMMKGLSLGRDNVTGHPLKSRIHELQSMPEIMSGSIVVSDPPQLSSNYVCRIWIEPEKVELELAEDRQSLLFTTAKMQALVHSSTEPDLLEAGSIEFAKMFTKHYDTLAQEFPVFQELKRLGQITAVVKWIKENRLPFDCQSFSGRQVPMCETICYTPEQRVPYTTQSITPAALDRFKRTGGNFPLTIRNQVVCGGIRMRLTDANCTSHVGTQAAKVGQIARTSRPNEHTFNWKMPGHSTQAIAAPMGRTAKDGNVKYTITDVHYPARGAFSLTLQRNYDSFDDRVTSFGFGWSCTPSSLRFPGYQATFYAPPTSFNSYHEVYVIDSGHEETFHVQSVNKEPYRLYYSNPTNTKHLTCTFGQGYTLDTPHGASEFDLQGRLLSQKDPNGVTLSYIYEGQQLVRIEHDCGAHITLHYENDRPVKATGPGGKEIYYTFDSEGHLHSVTNQEGHTTIYSYDNFGRLISVQDPNKNALFQTEYDVYNRAIEWRSGATVTQAKYDLYHGSTEVAQSDGTQLADHYDHQKRLTDQQQNGHTVKTYTYGQDALPVAVTDAKGNTTSLESGLDGQVTRIVNACGHAMEVQYTPDHAIGAVRSPNGMTTRYERDDQGRVVRTSIETESGELHASSSYTYDPLNGDLITVTDAIGGVTRYSYDEAGRPIAVASPTGHCMHYSYDARGRIARVTDHAYIDACYEYDLADRVIATVEGGMRTEYEYDAVGNMIVKKVGLEEWRFVYDASNQLVEIRDGGGEHVTFSYTEQGLPSRIIVSNGMGLMRQYDANGRLTLESAQLAA